MTDQCTASPMVARDDNTVPAPARRPPMMKSHTIQTPSDPVFYPHGDPNEAGPPIQGYGYHNQPNQPLFQNQARGYQIRPAYPPYPPHRRRPLGTIRTHRNNPHPMPRVSIGAGHSLIRLKKRSEQKSFKISAVRPVLLFPTCPILSEGQVT